jgi:ribosomal protein S18 acetylase RimI-like enzyme
VTPPEVIPLAVTDVPVAVETLTAAFADYPLLRTLAPNPVRRPRVVEAFCGMLVRYADRHGRAYTTPDRAAVACWVPPGREWLTWPALIRSGALTLAWRLGVLGTIRLERLEMVFDRLRTADSTGPHWYLPLVGVRPDRKGQGLARAVLRPVFDSADRDRVRCYLDTQEEMNVGIYRGLGFEVAAEAEPTPGLRTWTMRRDPRPA